MIGTGREIYQAENAEAVDISSTDHTVTSQADGSEDYATLYVGGAGDVVVVMKGGQQVTFSSVPAGSFLPILIKTVVRTNTTATNMVALYN